MPASVLLHAAIIRRVNMYSIMGEYDDDPFDDDTELE